MWFVVKNISDWKPQTDIQLGGFIKIKCIIFTGQYLAIYGTYENPEKTEWCVFKNYTHDLNIREVSDVELGCFAIMPQMYLSISWTPYSTYMAYLPI